MFTSSSKPILKMF